MLTTERVFWRRHRGRFFNAVFKVLLGDSVAIRPVLNPGAVFFTLVELAFEQDLSFEVVLSVAPVVLVLAIDDFLIAVNVAALFLWRKIIPGRVAAVLAGAEPGRASGECGGER